MTTTKVHANGTHMKTMAIRMVTIVNTKAPEVIYRTPWRELQTVSLAPPCGARQITRTVTRKFDGTDCSRVVERVETHVNKRPTPRIRALATDAHVVRCGQLISSTYTGRAEENDRDVEHSESKSFGRRTSSWLLLCVRRLSHCSSRRTHGNRCLRPGGTETETKETIWAPILCNNKQSLITHGNPG